MHIQHAMRNFLSEIFPAKISLHPKFFAQIDFSNALVREHRGGWTFRQHRAVAQDTGSPIGAVAAPSGPPPSVALGQTTDQVKAILGNPTKTADVGPKTIYYYDGMKVVFKAGKVTDVE